MAHRLLRFRFNLSSSHEEFGVVGFAPGYSCRYNLDSPKYATKGFSIINI